MKKLYFLLPIASWFVCYHTWKYSERFYGVSMLGGGLWWVITDIMVGVLFLLTIGYALHKNGLLD